MENKEYNRDEVNKKYYWYRYFDVNKRLEILKNNNNFKLSDEDLEELVKQKCSFWSKRNLSFRQYIKAYYEDFREKLQEEIKKMTALNDKWDIILLWGNYNRVLEITIWLDNVLD